jgi:uncharacterized membrane protein YhaH (DUF805 family)
MAERRKSRNFLNTRMNRATYWFALAFCLVVYAILNAASSETVAMSEVVLVLLSVPRLHDLGRSGWWAAIPIGVEFAAVILAFVLLPFETMSVVAGIITLTIAIFLIALGMLPGQPQANRFGDPPAPGLDLWGRKRKPVEDTFD